MSTRTIGIRQHRFGVNYTPVRSWYYCWNDFQPDAIARDFDSIAALGADHIRTMLIWPYFQPNPAVISKAHLDRLDKLMELAAERGLDVCLTLFVGWLSGYAFKPPFQPDESFYALEGELSAQELYVRTVAEVAGRHENFLGFDLGNELNCCWKSPELHVGDRWTNHMLQLAKECVPKGVHVNGVDHNPWFMKETFSPQNLAQSHEIIPLHCWTYFTDALRLSDGNCMDPRCLRLPEGMASLARAYAEDPCKPIWIQEYGMSEAWTDPASIPEFLRRTTRIAVDSGVSWFTWWCSHDLDPGYRFNPVEYSLGLITVDQTIKPQGAVFKELADAFRGNDVTMDPQVKNLSLTPVERTPQSTWRWLEAYFEAHSLNIPTE